MVEPDGPFRARSFLRTIAARKSGGVRLARIRVAFIGLPGLIHGILHEYLAGRPDFLEVRLPENREPDAALGSETVDALVVGLEDVAPPSGPPSQLVPRVDPAVIVLAVAAAGDTVYRSCKAGPWERWDSLSPSDVLRLIRGAEPRAGRRPPPGTETR